MPKICYFSIYTTEFPRDRVLLHALEKAGYEIISCIDNKPSIQKYKNIFSKHRALYDEYDLALIGYTAHVLVPLIKLISRKKIVFNASNSIYEAVILDREKKNFFSILAIKSWLIDFLAFHLSDTNLVETDSQADFLSKTFFVKRSKFVRVWTSVNEDEFFIDSAVEKNSVFTVLFRGAFLPFVGVEYFIEAARLIACKKIRFLILGSGILEKKIRQDLLDHPVPNLMLITEFLPLEELRAKMLGCAAAVAQVSCHPRVSRTITNKTFEYLALGLPFVTADVASNRELLKSNRDCLFVTCGNPIALAEAILRLYDDFELREKLGRNARALFEKEMTIDAIKQLITPVFDKLIQKG